MALDLPSSNMGITAEYVTALEKRIAQLEKQISSQRLPNTDLLSPSFLRRAFTVWGHMFVAQLLIALPIYCLIFLLGAMSGW